MFAPVCAAWKLPVLGIEIIIDLCYHIPDGLKRTRTQRLFAVCVRDFFAENMCCAKTEKKYGILGGRAVI